jgi:23S rRNA pseudouridine1911/1915/1917 synthase
VDDVPQRFDFDSLEHRVFEVAAKEDGERLDQFLASRLEGFSRAGVQRLVRGGWVQVNGSPCRPASRVHEGDTVSAGIPEILEPGLEPEDLPLEVLIEEPSFVVIDKRPGMAVHPGRGRIGGTIANAILYRYGSVGGPRAAYRPGIVHRLDLETSGVMVVARTEAAHGRLAAAFKARDVSKQYRALVHGDPAYAEDRIDLPLGRDLVHPTRMGVRFDGGREAVTDYAVVERFGGAADLLCRPVTGRTHQIRVHLASRGHPILGDPVYGGHRRPVVTVPRLMLHALGLTFPHPESGDLIEVVSPLPEDFRAAQRALREIDEGPVPD